MSQNGRFQTARFLQYVWLFLNIMNEREELAQIETES